MGFLLSAVLALATLVSGPRTADFSKLERTYSIHVLESAKDFRVETIHGPITGTAAEPAAVEAYARLLNFEFGLYPRPFVRSTRLKNILLCRSLAFDGQVRSSVPDFGSNTLYFDVSRGSEVEFYQRRVIHHEFFHIVDWRDDGLLYRDDAWTALNAEGFEYGTGGINAQDDARMGLVTDEHPGFLTLYSRSGVEEDKAELFSFLFVDPALVARRVASDEILARKVERMRELLAEVSSAFDAEYWKKIGAIERNASGTPRPEVPAAEQR